MKFVNKVDLASGSTMNSSIIATATDLAGKANSVHSHAIADVTGLQTALDGKSPTGHSHVIADVSGLQTALDGKQATVSGAASTIVGSNLSASMALVSDVNGKVAVHTAVSATELGYLDGVTSNVQTQLDSKAATTHSHSLTFTGDVSGSVTLDNTADTVTVTLASTGVTAGTYTKLTVDAKGRATSGSNLTAADIPSLDWSKITTGVPTTLSGYGITDGTPMFGLPPNGATIMYYKVAEMTTAIGTSENHVTLYVNGASDYGTNQPGIDIVQMSTRGSTALKAYRLIPGTTAEVTYGYVTNASSGKTELWMKRDTYHNTCKIIVGTAVNATYGNMLSQSTEPAGITYVTKTNLALTTDNVASATKLETARTIALTGDVSAAGVSFDGTGNISLSTTVANKYARGYAANYTSVSGDDGTDGWYTLFIVSDNTDVPVLCNIKAYAHTSMSFIASKGYSTGFPTLTILQVNVGNNNPSYKYLKGLRILTDGSVQVKLNGGATVQIQAQIVDNGAGTSLVGTLTKDTNATPDVGQLIDPLVNGSMVSKGDIYVGSTKVWHANNDGTGSGLDADLLDGLDSLAFVKKDGSVAMSGLLTLSGDPTSALQPVTKQMLDRKIGLLSTNALYAKEPIDRYPAGIISAFKHNGGFGSWPASAGLVITYSVRDTTDDNQSGTMFPGTLHQVYFQEGSTNSWIRYANASMAYTNITAWVASTAVALNAYKMPASRTTESGYYYKCTTAGTTGATEPTWPTTIGATVTDGTAVWTCQAAFWGNWDKNLSSSSITSSDVTTALGYTPLNLAGGTMTGDINVHVGSGVMGIRTTGYYGIGLKDYNNDTWLRNEGGRWTFQTGTSANDWTKSFQIYQPIKDTGSGLNDTFIEIGQRQSNSSSGTYKGVRITKVSGAAIVDGDMQAGTYAIGSTIVIESDGKMDWNKVKNTPTTLSGYGITNALNSAPDRLKYTVPTGGIAAGTAVTIPNSKSYVIANGTRMHIYRDGWLQEPVDDYTETSTTSVTFTYALPEGSKLTFIIWNAG